MPILKRHLDKGGVVEIYIPEAVVALKIQKFLECIFVFEDFLYGGVDKSPPLHNDFLLICLAAVWFVTYYYVSFVFQNLLHLWLILYRSTEEEIARIYYIKVEGGVVYQNDYELVYF